LEVDREKEELLALLAPFRQEHVLAFWDELEGDRRAALAAQVRALPLKEIYALYRAGTALHNWAEVARRAMAPPAFRLRDRARSVSPEAAYDRGQAALNAGLVGVILVAGGEGTRLGFAHPKGMFPIGPVSGASLFQILIEKILARSRVSGIRIPLYLMTSPATHQATLDYLAASEHFGMAAEDITVFCQGTMPAVDVRSGRLLLTDKHALALSPDGHGGMLQALDTSGALADIRRRGLRHLFYCQIDNPLVEMCDPEFLGYHLLSNSELSTQVVAKRTSRDKVGNVVAIDGKLQIIEYSDLNPLADEIVERRGPEGEPVFWAGSTAIHVIDADLLTRTARSDALPFHLARKSVTHVDSSGSKVEPAEPNAIKFERFIFDLMPLASQAVVVEVDEARAFAPLKNAPGDERDTPQSVQRQMGALHAEWLRAAGCELAADARVEISPLFAQNADEVAARIRPGLTVTGSRYFC
jgi:UDP-N-acetylglucosamine/UDP-N-acetylgalactosamine diphosphorylase